MANRGELPDHPAPAVQHVMAWAWGHAADVVPAAGHRRDHQHHLHLLDAARALMLLGAVAAVSTVFVGNGGNPGAAAAARVLLGGGFVAWLLGVGLLSFIVPAEVAGRGFLFLPQAADALAGAAIANASAVLVYLFTPWN